MLKSLQLYADHLARILPRPERRLLWLDLRRFNLLGEDNFDSSEHPLHAARNEALEAAVEWLLEAQKATSDNGFGSYHMARGWSASYPETTGYIIPTLLEYDRKFDQERMVIAALKAADFLLSIQKENGGWQGGRIGEDKPAIVFNTGQVIRGMIAVFERTGQQKYLESAAKAGDWLASIQHPEGYWKKHALMEEARVYDTFVDVPLIMLSTLTGKEKYKEVAVKNLDWVVEKKMQPNGWFEDCDNTVKRNDKPILHTIAYTLDGLIDSGLLLSEKGYTDAATIGAKVLMEQFLAQGNLKGRYDRNWKGSEYLICTGGAQMAIAWMKLFKAGKGDNYKVAARKMLDFLVFIQLRETTERPRTGGAIPGSYPIWGRYEPFAFPNWATKFFCDALMMEEEIDA